MAAVWIIEYLKKDVDADRAIISGWRCTDKDGEAIASACGTVSIADQASGVPFDNINEAQAIAWTKAALGSEVGQIESSLAGSVARKKNPKVVKGIPWA